MILIIPCIVEPGRYQYNLHRLLIQLQLLPYYFRRFDYLIGMFKAVVSVLFGVRISTLVIPQDMILNFLQNVGFYYHKGTILYDKYTITLDLRKNNTIQDLPGLIHYFILSSIYGRLQISNQIQGQMTIVGIRTEVILGWLGQFLALAVLTGCQFYQQREAGFYHNPISAFAYDLSEPTKEYFMGFELEEISTIIEGIEGDKEKEKVDELMNLQLQLLKFEQMQILKRILCKK